MKYAGYVYLAMATLWGAIAVFWYFNPDDQQNAGFADIKVVIAILLSVYCLIRWWSRQMLGRSRASSDDYGWRRPPVRRASDESAPNPEFNFDAQEPGADDPPKASGD